MAPRLQLLAGISWFMGTLPIWVFVFMGFQCWELCLITAEMPGAKDLGMLGKKRKCMVFPLQLPKHETCCRCLWLLDHSSWQGLGCLCILRQLLSFTSMCPPGKPQLWKRCSSFSWWSQVRSSSWHRAWRRSVVLLCSAPAPFLRLWVFPWSAIPELMRVGWRRELSSLTIGKEPLRPAMNASLLCGAQPSSHLQQPRLQVKGGTLLAATAEHFSI